MSSPSGAFLFFFSLLSLPPRIHPSCSSLPTAHLASGWFDGSMVMHDAGGALSLSSLFSVGACKCMGCKRKSPRHFHPFYGDRLPSSSSFSYQARYSCVPVVSGFKQWLFLAACYNDPIVVTLSPYEGSLQPPDLVLVGKDVIEPEIKGYLWRDFDSDSDR